MEVSLNYKGVPFTLHNIFENKVINISGEAITLYEINHERICKYNDLVNIYTTPTLLLFNYLDAVKSDNNSIDEIKILAEVDIQKLPLELANMLINDTILVAGHFTRFDAAHDIKIKIIKSIIKEIDVIREAKYVNTGLTTSERYSNLNIYESILLKPFNKTNIGDAYADYIPLFSANITNIITSPTLQMQYKAYKELDNKCIMTVFCKYDEFNDTLFIFGSSIETDKQALLPYIQATANVPIYDERTLQYCSDFLNIEQMGSNGVLMFFTYNNEMTLENLEIIKKQLLLNTLVNGTRNKHRLYKAYLDLSEEVAVSKKRPVVRQRRSSETTEDENSSNTEGLGDTKEENSPSIGQISHKKLNNILNGITEEDAEDSLDDEEDPFDDPFTDDDFKPKFTANAANIDSNLSSAINQWITNTTYKDFCSEINKVVLGQAQLNSVLLIVWTYLQGLANQSNAQRNNTIITAPSGTGKTETYRALKSYFKIRIPKLPVVILDAMDLTSNGFTGKDNSDWLEPLLSAGTNGAGIVFIDEFDKMITPRWTNKHEDVSKSIQSQLLTIVEGTEWTAVNKRTSSYTINTKNTLFIAIGSFAAIRESKQEKSKADNKNIGFNVDGNEKTNEIDIYDKITKTDMVDAGGIYEFLGRFPVVVNYGKLNEESIKIIINRFKHDIEQSFNSTIQLEIDYLDYLVSEASGEFGLRNIYNIILEDFLPIYSKLLLNQKEKNLIVLTKDTKVQDYLVELAIRADSDCNNYDLSELNIEKVEEPDSTKTDDDES